MKKCRTTPQYPANGSRGGGGGGGGGVDGGGGNSSGGGMNSCFNHPWQPGPIAPGDLVQFFKDQAALSATTAAHVKHQEDIAAMQKKNDEKFEALNAALIQGERAKTELVLNMMVARVDDLKSSSAGSAVALQRANEYDRMNV
jgi:hypothetical protein